jgi:hypothetical protein
LTYSSREAEPPLDPADVGAQRHDAIALFYLPSYSPALNPEEKLNAEIEREMGKRATSHFQDRRVRYAA